MYGFIQKSLIFRNLSSSKMHFKKCMKNSIFNKFERLTAIWHTQILHISFHKAYKIFICVKNFIMNVKKRKLKIKKIQISIAQKTFRKIKQNQIKRKTMLFRPIIIIILSTYKVHRLLQNVSIYSFVYLLQISRLLSKNRIPLFQHEYLKQHVTLTIL